MARLLNVTTWALLLLDMQTTKHIAEAKSMRGVATSCVDKSPPSWHRLKTCDEQLNKSDRCEFRRSGQLNDGLCAKTCRVCIGDRKPDQRKAPAHFIFVASAQRSGSTEMSHRLSRHRCVHNFNEMYTGLIPQLSGDAGLCTTATGFKPLGPFLKAVWKLWSRWNESATDILRSVPDPVKMLEHLRASACKGLDRIYASRSEPLCGSRCAVVVKLFAGQLPRSFFSQLLRSTHAALIILERNPARAECSLRHAEQTNDWHLTPNSPNNWHITKRLTRKMTGTIPFNRSACPKQAGAKFLNAHQEWYEYLLGLTRYRKALYVQSADFFKHETSYVLRALHTAGFHTEPSDLCPLGTVSTMQVCGLKNVSSAGASCRNGSQVWIEYNLTRGSR